MRVLCGIRGGRAFSMLELLLVLFLMALSASLVLPSSARLLRHRNDHAQLRALVEYLAAQRLTALKEAGAVTVSLERARQELRVRTDHGNAVWEDWHYAMVPEDASKDGVVRIVFDHAGRASIRRLQWLDVSDSRWTIEFDPLSGRPSLHRSQENTQ